MLYHDLGKVDGKKHSHSGVLLVNNDLKKIGYPEIKLERIYLLIEKHLMMSMISQRRNLSEEKTILDFTKQIKDLENLKLLYCLTYADMRAVGPGIWNDWKGSLLQSLYLKSEKMFLGQEIRLKHENIISKIIHGIKNESCDELILKEHLNAMPSDYFTTFNPKQMLGHIIQIQQLKKSSIQFEWVWHSELNTMELSVYTMDTPGIFQKIAGVLSSQKINIINAQVFSRNDGIVIDKFLIQTLAHEHFINEKKRFKIQVLLKKALQNEIWVEELISKEILAHPDSQTPIKITFNNEESITHTIIEIQTTDHIGLLYKISKSFHDLGIDIHLAKLSTHKDQVIDSFYVVDYDKQKIEGNEAQSIVTEELKKIIQG